MRSISSSTENGSAQEPRLRFSGRGGLRTTSLAAARHCRALASRRQLVDGDGHLAAGHRGITIWSAARWNRTVVGGDPDRLGPLRPRSATSPPACQRPRMNARTSSPRPRPAARFHRRDPAAAARPPAPPPSGRHPRAANNVKRRAFARLALEVDVAAALPMMPYTVESPSPVPLPSALVVKKGSNRCDLVSASIPTPCRLPPASRSCPAAPPDDP